MEPYNGAVKRWHAQGMEDLVEPYNGAVKRWHAKVWRAWWNPTMEQLKGGMPRHGGSWNPTMEQLKGAMLRQGGSGGTLQWSS